MTLRDLKPLELVGFRYFRGTLRTFGLLAALGQMSPLLTTVLTLAGVWG